MSTFVLEKWYEGSKCSIYSIRQDVENEDSYTEADKFFEKYGQSDLEEIKESAQLLLQFLVKEICEVHGARIAFFNRNESKAQALPYKVDRSNTRIFELNYFYKNFPLRLYCYWISEEIVVLFNGGVKTSSSAQKSPDLSMKFQEAQIYVTKIERAFREKFLTIAHSEIISDDTPIILY